MPSSAERMVAEGRGVRRWYREPAVVSAVIGATAVVLAALVTGIFGLLRPPPRERPLAPDAPAPAGEPRETSPLTFETFLATSTDPTLTELQRRAFLDEQLHRRVEWEGRVQTVRPMSASEPGDRVLLELAPEGDAVHVASCWFAAGWSTDLLALRPGQWVTVSGVLEASDANGPRLVGCRLQRF